MKEIHTLCNILLTLLPLLYAYMVVYAIIGFFTTKHFPKAKRQHRYGIVIAARNEAGVIGELLDSIAEQTYPNSLITTFVVADNCTDNTAKIARQNGAVCYERFDENHRTKGFALQYLFRQIKRDYGINHFDGYLILDADNILKEDYIEKMNDAFDSGEKIITSYRNTKNLKAGCIAASYALHWLRTVRLESRARSVLGLATRIQGTGILFASELVKDGWNYTNLTEDRSFCMDAVLQGYSISYQQEAEFFDEQPVTLTIAMRQRIRWAKGHFQAFTSYSSKLFLHIFSSNSRKQKFMAYDMLLIAFPQAFARIVISCINIFTYLLIWLTVTFPAAVSVTAATSTARTLLLYGQLKGAIIALVTTLFFSWLRQTAMAAYVLFMERKRLEPLSLMRKIWYCVTFFLFDSIGGITYVIAAVTKVEWKPIPHHSLKETVKKREHQTPSRAA